jgi:hypothetical protein
MLLVREWEQPFSITLTENVEPLRRAVKMPPKRYASDV